MLSASNMPIPEHEADTTSVLLLPAFAFIDNVTPSNVPSLIADYVSKGPVNTTPLLQSASPTPPAATTTETDEEASSQPGPVSGPILKSRACPHQYLILLCSQKTRDARCGQSAPLLRREFERHLRPLGLHRDLHDERPGGVGIYFISHVGGHKFSANVMIYRKDGTSGSTIDQSRPKETTESSLEGSEVSNIGQAAQCIWLARVRPEDCENIVRYTVLQGKVVKPERQLRGGFDRSKRLVSW
jgi:(2Fe-2S) ferredoxin